MSSTTATTTTTTITSKQIFSQAFKILNANSFHFITISLLFIPFTIVISHPIAVIINISTVSQNLLPLKTLTALLAVNVTVLLSTVSRIALITYSSHQAINRKPLTFISTFKSLSHSFIPFIFTLFVITHQIILLLAFTISSSIQVISFELLFVVIWGYAAAISVLESKSGFTPLIQSIIQLVQFCSVSFLIVIFTGFIIFSSLCFCPTEYDKVMTSMWISILHLGPSYMLASFAILFYVVANTVLYVKCKVARGEEIANTPAEGGLSGSEVQDGMTEGFSFMMLLFGFVRTIALCIAGDINN